ncbi:MAG TPA: FecR family protein, partial [Usitatibacter sp.]|nr:FecR family protein [Usitatibacter sp.]
GALAASGEFTFVVGEVSLTKSGGQRVTPAKGTAVDPGDRIVTGVNGMAQLTMVDQARLSLRPSTQFVIEAYPDRRESEQGGVLNLIKGTLRTFTGLIASNNRDKFVMKTRVATVGIRGSGNILYACEDKECDESVVGAAGAQGAFTVNHTIDGSHAVTNALAEGPPGMPPQQGGATTLITGPGQTVLVSGAQPPRYIPTPRFIAEAAINMTGGKAAEAASPSATGDTRNFAPSDDRALPPAQQANVPIVGNNGLGFPIVDASGNLSSDRQRLRDIVITLGTPFFSQAEGPTVTREGDALRGYDVYLGGLTPVIEGGTLVDFNSVTLNGALITMGRWGNASVGFFGPGSGAQLPGSIHFIDAPSGYPPYLADVLTGSVTYTLAANTSPTNQNNVAGTLGSMTLDVNFSNRTLDFNAAVSMPATGTSGSGSWNMSAANVPISLNMFGASTDDRLVITNGEGVSSQVNPLLSGSFSGSFVGTGIGAAVVGYGISDTTSSSGSSHHIVSGVAALVGVAQDAAAPYREGRISDPNGAIGQFIRTYATTDRPAEVVANAQGAATSFSAPYTGAGSHATYALGTAQIVESGVDPETGMIWGRWGGGVATISGSNGTQQMDLHNRSLHYIFGGAQSGPVALPLTGIAVYDVIGSTRPTDNAGHVGNLNTATLNANFNNRTVDASVNIAINGQTWNGAASGMPIYRDQYFGAFTGAPIPGAPNGAPLILSCTPNCGAGAAGSFDGFFAGATGQRAGMMYNLGGNQGAVAFSRRGSGP